MDKNYFFLYEILIQIYFLLKNTGFFKTIYYTMKRKIMIILMLIEAFVYFTRFNEFYYYFFFS